MENLVEIKGLVKRYSDFTLGPIDLCVPPGEVVGLVGGNGAGKTTTLKVLMGRVQASAGQARLMGVPCARESRELAQARQHVGVVVDTCPFPDLRVRAVGRMGAIAFENWDDALFSQLVERFGLGARARVGELSRGMGMKLQMAFALAHRPRLLVLDEPTAGLDPIAREEVLDLLRAFMEGAPELGGPGVGDPVAEERAVLMSTHITSDLDKLADRVVCIDGGKIAFDLPKDDICDEAGIARMTVAQFERVRDALRTPDVQRGSGMRALERAGAVELLVPDRRAFAQAYPQVTCAPATIEDYMALTLRGERL